MDFLNSAARAAINLTGPHIRVPHDLVPLTHIAEEAVPEAGGLGDAGVAKIVQALEALYRSGAHPGISFCLRRQGRVILNRSYGHASGNGPAEPRSIAKTPMLPETPVCIFSASKAVTAMLAHKLSEEGGIDLHEPVARYLPEYGQFGKDSVTIRDVLSHRSGVPSLKVAKAERKPELLTNWDDIVARICRSPGVKFKPLAYHALTGGYIIGEIIRRVTGMSVSDYLDSRIRQPMGMKHFSYGLPKQYRGIVAHNYIAGARVVFPVAQMIERALIVPIEEVVEASNTDAFMDSVIPSGNLYATAEELSRFFQMMLDGGEWQGKRIFKPETISRAVRPRGNWAPDAMLLIPMRYSAGMMLGGPMSLYGPGTTGAYGHLGFMNILGWADPNRDISCSLLVTGKAVLGAHMVPWMQLLTTIGRVCKGR